MAKPLLFLFSIVLSLCLSSHAAIVVNKLDNIVATNLVYSGMLPISDSLTDQMFFTYYSAKEAKQDTDIPNYPLIVVVGSPGSSAQYFNLAGMGPLTLRPDMTTVPNPNTLTNFANLMFVDLLASGFSFVANSTNFPTKSEDYGSQLTYAINALSKESPLGKSKTIVLVGEGMFLRSLPGLNDISGLAGVVHLSAWP
jgi:carboxypeptidase C (cathepsin A)